MGLPRRSRRVDDDRVDDRRSLEVLKAVLKKLGLRGHQHTFRHSLITRALTDGVPEAVVRGWVGHVDSQVTRLYTHIADKDSKAHMERLFGGVDNSSVPTGEESGSKSGSSAESAEASNGENPA